MKSPIRSVRKKGRFNLFFMEMIIVLLFFSIAAAVILRSFAASDRLARESRRMESMTFCAQSAAEIYSRTASISETANTLFGGVFASLELKDIYEITVPMTADCEYSAASPVLYMTMRDTAENYGGGDIMKLSIIFRDGSGETVYEVESGAYNSERAVSRIE